MMLSDHVIGLKHRAREHKLPTDFGALEFEGATEVELSLMPGDEDDPTLGCNHFCHSFPNAIDLIEVSDVIDRFKP